MIQNIKIDYLRMSRPLERNTAWNNLMADMRFLGQTQPILVKKLHDNMYEVVDGNKRLGCAFALGWTTLNCELVG